MSQKKMRILKKMAAYAKQSRPNLSEKRTLNNMKRLYNELDSKTKASIKGLTVEK